MYGIQDSLEGRIDVFNLNWDDKSIDGLRQELDISGRSQYMLLDPDGNVLKRWFGPLNPNLLDEVEATLAEAGY